MVSVAGIYLQSMSVAMDGKRVSSTSRYTAVVTLIKVYNELVHSMSWCCLLHFKPNGLNQKPNITEMWMLAQHTMDLEKTKQKKLTNEVRGPMNIRNRCPHKATCLIYNT